MNNRNIYIDEKTEDLIATYFTEGLDEKNMESLNLWIGQSPEHKRYFQNIQEIWFASAYSGKAKNYDSEKAYNRFLLKTGVLHSKREKSFYRIILYGAAAVIFILLTAYTAYWQGTETVKNQFAEMIIEAPAGSRTKMYLPDGSLVWLNALSKVSYSQGFGVNNRMLHLIGEGYFEVSPNERLPFQVRTGELYTDVIGTKFNFRNYPDEEEATVCLMEGKVLVRNIMKEDDQLFLSPDQKVFLNKKNGEMRVKKVKTQHAIQWTNGHLFFDEELLVDIAKELERSYNVKITLKDKSLESLRFYGFFIHREQTIDEILDLLGSTGKFKYEKTKTGIILSSK